MTTKTELENALSTNTCAALFADRDTFFSTITSEEEAREQVIYMLANGRYDKE